MASGIKISVSFYLSMALGLYENTLQTIPNFTRIDHLRQGMEVFSNENPTHERAALIRSIAKDILPKKNPNEVKRKRTKLEDCRQNPVPASQRPTQTGCKETQSIGKEISKRSCACERTWLGLSRHQ